MFYFSVIHNCGVHTTRIVISISDEESRRFHGCQNRRESWGLRWWVNLIASYKVLPITIVGWVICKETIIFFCLQHRNLHVFRWLVSVSRLNLAIARKHRVCLWVSVRSWTAHSKDVIRIIRSHKQSCVVAIGRWNLRESNLCVVCRNIWCISVLQLV